MAVWSIITASELAAQSRFDGEFYQAAYLALDKNFSKMPKIDSMGHLSQWVKKGIFDISPTKYRTEGVPLVRTLQIKQPLLSAEGLVFIEPDCHKRDYRKTELLSGDLVFTKIGAGIGDVALLPDTFANYNFSQNVAGASVSRDKIAPEYLLAYLLTSYGRQQLLRFMMPSGQGKLELRDIKKIKVARLGNDEALIASKVSAAQKTERKSVENYSEAQRRLDAELGLNRKLVEKPLGYTALFSEIEISRRADADFFQVPYRENHRLLDSLKTAHLSQLASITKGVEVGSKSYSTSGHLFIRVSNFKEGGMTGSPSDKYISDSLYQSLSAFRAEVGELLLTKDGSPGVCFAVDEELDGIICSGIVKLKPFTDEVPSEYLALVINSKVCRMQTEQECSGALILHWKPASIRKLRIPILADQVMEEIAALVSSSKEAKRESERLLAEAKCRVEQLIEETLKS